MIIYPGNWPNLVLRIQTDRLLTVRETATLYFQGKISPREVNALFHRGLLRGFRVGTGKGKILIYEWSLDEYRIAQENCPPASPREYQPRPTPAPRQRRTRGEPTGFQVFRLPDKAMPNAKGQG